MSRKQRGTAALAQLCLWFASRMVTRGTRREWMAEWNAELCHVCSLQAGAPLQFSLGAFQDAFWLRSDRMRSLSRLRLASGSASRCLLTLMLFAAGGPLMCLWLPGVRLALSAPYRDPANLVIISSDGYAGTQSPSISLSEYRNWTANAHRLFRQIAFYRPAVEGVHLPGGVAVQLSMGFASPNLLRVMELSGWHRRLRDARAPQLYLSESAWQARFHSDPGLIGRTVLIAGAPATITGIVSDDQWRLPGGMDALLIGDAHELSTLPGDARGFVIARVRPSVLLADRSGWRSMFEYSNGVILTLVQDSVLLKQGS